jgi:hypothetical protein
MLPEKPLWERARVLARRRGKRRTRRWRSVGRQAQMMATFNSTEDQVAAPTLSQVISVATEAM